MLFFLIFFMEVRDETLSGLNTAESGGDRLKGIEEKSVNKMNGT